jgi:hypothetical protein
MPPFRQIEFLYSNLEQARCVFVDGILETLLRSRQISLVRNESEVEDHAVGASAMAWRLLRRAYRNRIEPGLTTRVSRSLWLRRGWAPRGRLLRLLRRDLRYEFIGHDRPLVVDHAVLPLLIRAGGGIVYNHGELAFGRSNAAMAADWVLVPTSEVAGSYIHAGFHPERIIVTGLCIEAALVAQAVTAFEQRMTRIEDGEPLTGAVFSDEAEPPSQVRDIVEGVVSVCRTQDSRLFVFCRVGGRLARRLQAALMHHQIPWGVVDGTRGIGAEVHPVIIVQIGSRREERGLIARLFAELDFVVAPPREKLVWAVGLGLPVIWLRRGLNEVEKETEHVGQTLDVARSVHSGKARTMLGPLVGMLHESGQLERMARAGWGKQSLDGFVGAAQFLANLCEE